MNVFNAIPELLGTKTTSTEQPPTRPDTKAADESSVSGVGVAGEPPELPPSDPLAALPKVAKPTHKPLTYDQVRAVLSNMPEAEFAPALNEVWLGWRVREERRAWAQDGMNRSILFEVSSNTSDRAAVDAYSNRADYAKAVANYTNTPVYRAFMDEVAKRAGQRIPYASKLSPGAKTDLTQVARRVGQQTGGWDAEAMKDRYGVAGVYLDNNIETVFASRYSDKAPQRSTGAHLESGA